VTTLTIRDMQESDLPAVLAIEQISFSNPWTSQAFLDQMYGKHALSKVAMYEEKVAGYICVHYLLHEAHILDLALHPDLRRLGIATILIREVEIELKKRGCVFAYLKVRASNAGAIRFYELSGFKVVEVRKKYYEDPEEDALLMMARL
jgi:[ribosomal protein S18]-alanine N-acetyltransferase